jgi:hypothetical protein
MARRTKGSDNPPIPGAVYGYIEPLEAKFPEDNQVITELAFRKQMRDIPTTRAKNGFVVDCRHCFLFNIKSYTLTVMRRFVLTSSETIEEGYKPAAKHAFDPDL